MINSIDNYKLAQCISTDGFFALYHAYNNFSQTSCLLKFPVEKPANETIISFLKNEYSMCDRIKDGAILKPVRFIRLSDSCIIEFHHCDLIPFTMALGRDKLTRQSFISDALAITKITASLHDAGIIHRNLSLSSFLKSISTGTIYSTGFYISTTTREHDETHTLPLFYSPNCAYMAPEQTGNIDRSIDERTDLYSLGVLFYEMLCGEPPFTDPQPAGLMYSHVTRKPQPLHERDQTIPRPISDILQKLLEKNPADRYQSVHGLHADLETCSHTFTGKCIAAGFTPGAKDQITRLLPVKKLHGRDLHLKALRDAFLSAEKGTTSVVLLSGRTGSGKSRLIDFFVNTIDIERAMYAYGKCEESCINSPYHSLKSALVELIRSIIARGNESVAFWKNIFIQSTAHTRELIADFLPEIQMIIGPCAKPKFAADSKAGTQFKNVITPFLQSLLNCEIPIILCIDDFQWADSALADILIPAFCESPSSRLLLIAASREPFAATHPFRHLPSAGITVSNITCEQLSFEESHQITGDMLGSPPSELEPLNKLIYDKTLGNPFFHTTFIDMLLAKNLLYHQIPRQIEDRYHLQQQRGKWQWDSEAILQLNCTDNVADIIVDKAVHLPVEVRSLLTIASCMGTTIDTSILAAVMHYPEESISALLSTAFTHGILRRTASRQVRQQKTMYAFSHDHIRETLYERIDPEERTRIHLLVGRTLVQRSGTPDNTISPYDIVKHFNPYLHTITSSDERLFLAHCNKDASLLARNAHAYQIAMDYLHAAAKCCTGLPENEIKNLRIDIELCRSECEYLTARHEAALQRLETLEKMQLDTMQAAQLDLRRMSIYDSLQKNELLLETGFKRLHALGISLPHKPSVPYLAVSLLDAMRLSPSLVKTEPLREQSPHPIPETHLLSFRILCRMWLQAFTLHKQSLVLAITLHLIRSTRTYGMCGATSVGLCFWGIMIGFITGNPRKALPYGDRALQIARHFDDHFSRGITLFLYSTFLAYLRGHIDDSLGLLAESKRYSYESGDIVSASNSAEGSLLFMALCGKKITDIRRECSATIAFLRDVGISEKEIKVPSIIDAWAANIGNTFTFNQIETEQSLHGELPLVQGIILLFSMITTVLTGNIESTLRYSKQLRKNPLISPHSYFHYFYLFITAYALTSPGRRLAGSDRRLLASCMAFLRKAAVNSPVNFQHCTALIGAETARIRNRFWEARQLYRKAIDHARNHGFLFHAALAAERAALFMHEYDVADSRNYLKTAISLYLEWGATDKAHMLKRGAPDLPFPTVTPVSALAEIDLQALIKSFEAISEELILDRLLEKLVRIVMENAGAERGVLLLENNGSFVVKVEGVLAAHGPHDRSGIECRSYSTPAGTFSIPQSIISLVSITGEAIRLENAAGSGRFVHDPYIKLHTVRSVICIPLTSNEATRGIIYLENNLLEGAFPPHRLHLLKLLSGQVVISIENALFHEMEIKHLQSKVNPHFIFNALSSIAELCHSDPGVTEDAIVKLSTLYRYILTAEMRMVGLREELDIVNKYLDIEKLRFGSRLSFAFNISGEITAVQMPSMILQPLVENSIKHGISPRPSGGTVSITIIIDAAWCDIVVDDDGIGPNKKNPGTGYGLSSIRKRLRLHYGTQALVEIDDTHGFKVHLHFPTVPMLHS